MTKAVAYLRVSGASQLDGDGFDRQIKTITAYASTHGFELVGVHREEAVPGKTELVKRPAFNAMLADLLSNGCRTIIVERLDRLAREYRIQEELLLYLMSHKLSLISADTGENITEAMSADPMKKALVQMRGIFAELDKSQTVIKLAKGRASVRAKGGFAGGNVPYGHTPKVADEERIARARSERATARRIRELRAQGLTLDAIRQSITAEGLPTRNGKPWQLSTIRQIATQGWKEG